MLYKYGRSCNLRRSGWNLPKDLEHGFHFREEFEGFRLNERSLLNPERGDGLEEMDGGGL